MRTLLFSLCLLAGLSVFAQSPTDVKVEIMKAQVDAISATYNYSAEIIEETLKKKFEDAKLGSGSKSKGYRLYKGVNFPEFGTELVDIYTKVDGKKDNATVTIAVSKGYNNFVNATTDEKLNQNIKAFLNNLNAEAGKYKLTKEIEEQESVVKKADKQKTGFESDGKDYKNEIEKLQKKIEQNQKDQEDARVNLEKQKAVLEEMKNRLTDMK